MFEQTVPLKLLRRSKEIFNSFKTELIKNKAIPIPRPLMIRFLA